MKLLLVNPYFEGVKPDAPQLGLYFLGTYIKEHTDWQVEVIDPLAEGLSKRDILNKVKNADIVGLTSFSDIRFQCFDFANKIKEVKPDCKVVIGGVHATALSEQILEEYHPVDIVVRGEGEETLLEIVKNNPYKQILGITWRDRDRIIKNANRPLIKNIDDLHLDYSLMPGIYANQWMDFEVPKNLLKLKHIPIIASRGCPYNCSFCSSHPHWGGMYRILSPKELVRRMEDLTNRNGAEYFRFYDALFPSNKRWVSEFCEILEERGLDVSFRIDIRAGGYSKVVLEQLRKVGCVVIGIGVESGSDRILKRINKGIMSKQIYETIKICKELDYWIIGYFMIGLPDETGEDIKKTIELIRHFDYHNYTRFQVYPNTSIYDELKQMEEISDKIWFDRKYDVPIKTKGGKDYFGEIRATSYCKENFSSAKFYQNELDWPIRYSFCFHNTRNPIAVIKKYGLVRGGLSLLKAGMDIPLRGRVHEIHHKLKDVMSK